jgi:hypothetical protein
VDAARAVVSKCVSPLVVGMTACGPSRHIAVVQQYGRLRSEADIGFGGSQASQERARIYLGPHIETTYGAEKLDIPDFQIRA